jgi:hypothetical protein
MALIALGKKEEACSSLNAAKNRSYADADAFIKTNCN